MIAGLNCRMQKPVERENYKEVMELLKHSLWIMYYGTYIDQMCYQKRKERT